MCVGTPVHHEQIVRGFGVWRDEVHRLVRRSRATAFIIARHLISCLAKKYVGSTLLPSDPSTESDKAYDI